MCGIFGYANYYVPKTTKQIFDILLGGLKRVEYRGFDSAGVCIDSTEAPNDSSQEVPSVVIKSVGNIDKLCETVADVEVQKEKKLNMNHVFSVNHVGIAHTRWATHGNVSVTNCHPHQSNKRDFTLVHNGILTNFMTVKQFLIDEGYHFDSETDSEVICVMAEYLHKKEPELNFVALTTRLLSLLEGAYALLIKSIYFPGEVMACSKGSPLNLGIRRVDEHGKRIPTDARHIGSTFEIHPSTELFFASDVNAFAEYTNDVLYLQDGDVAHYKPGKLVTYTVSAETHGLVDRVFHQVETTLEFLSKGQYEHFLLKEIHEQTESVVNSMRGRINFSTAEVHLGGFTEDQVEILRNSRRLLLVGCGTSLNSCIAARPTLEELLPFPVSFENSSDFLDRSPNITRADTCIFVSQSGETADTISALHYCRKKGALCVGLTNVVGSSLCRLTDFGAHLYAGVEVSVASTKSYTSQIILLLMIGLLISADSKKLHKRRLEIAQALSELPSKISQCLKMVSEPIEEIAKILIQQKGLLILGRGYDYATALEAALKIKELTYIQTEGINSGELKHGPLALVDENTKIIATCSRDKHFAKCENALQQVNARKGKIILITPDVDDSVKKCSWKIIEVPKSLDCVQSIVNIIPYQLLSYHMALAKGHNVDCPRNLAKSVTVH